MATPDDVVSFLIWKDVRGKTKVHLDSCLAFGTRTSFVRLSDSLGVWYGWFVDWEAESDLAALGRGSDDSGLPGCGNPAASRVVKDYLTSVREEQLQARVSPSQAEPFFLTDVVAVTVHIRTRFKEPGLTPKQIFILARFFYFKLSWKFCFLLETELPIWAGWKPRKFCIFRIRKESCLITSLQRRFAMAPIIYLLLNDVKVITLFVRLQPNCIQTGLL